MTLPKHLWQVTDQAVDDMQCCVDSEISKKVEKERFKHDRERSKKSRSKTTIGKKYAYVKKTKTSLLSIFTTILDRLLP